MPIVIKDFRWSQTDRTLIVRVPLRNCHPSKVDVFTAPDYLKASYEASFFEAFLARSVDVERSRCTLTDGEIIFELVKRERGAWERLEGDLSREERRRLRGSALEEERAKLREKDERLRERNGELKRVAVREQISLETRQRQLIERTRDEEKKSALGDLKSWRRDQEEDDEEEEEPKRPAVGKTAGKVPLPRRAKTLDVDFTAREFPTPCRESKLEEENEWLKNQAMARRSVGFAGEDLRAEERNPHYIKSKGDEFLKAGNYLGAISAFTFGIKLSEKLVDLYVGRSEAHFAVGNFNRTIQDCSKALELMTPALDVNFRERVACVSRRGQALCKLGYRREGIEELKVALQMLPSSEEIKARLDEALGDGEGR